MAKEIKEIPDSIKKLSWLALFYSLIDEADNKTAAKIKELVKTPRKRLDVGLGSEMFKAELLERVREEIRRKESDGRYK